LPESYRRIHCAFPDHQTFAARIGGLLKLAQLHKWEYPVYNRQPDEWLHLEQQTMSMRFFTFLLLLFTIVAQAQQAGSVKCSDAATYSIEGVLSTDSDKFPTMISDEEESFHVGDKGEMHKQFETKIFKSNITGWMSIGVVEVVSVKGKTIKFKVLEETAEITMNGEKRNQFRKDTRVKFSKYEYGVPVLDTLHYSSGKIKATGTSICDLQEGQWQSYSENGSVTSKYMMKGGKKTGAFESYYDNGKVHLKGDFADDKEVGEWTSFHENGVTESFIIYTDGRPSGRATAWYDNGKQRSETNYSVRGTLEGVSTEWFENGKVKSKERYRNGALDGVQEYYYENGQMDARLNYVNGVKTGKDEKWYENGQQKWVGNYDGDGKFHGLNERWSEEGKMILHENYIHGVLAGEVKSFYENGNLQDSGYYNSKGKKEGTWMYYYADGKPKEMRSYSSSTFHGAFAEYYENGKLKSRGSYSFGKEDGKWEEYYENGKKKSDGTYLNGSKIKTWYYWDESGKKRKEKHI
jgi:antitoxin component YwqK of YwqJK toxin-antitoxin module